MLAGMDAIGGFVGATSSGGGTGGSFAVSVDPTSVTKNASSRGAAKTLTTAPVTVTASGGAGGYTYSWARISGDTDIAADSSTAASTTFSATLLIGDNFATEFACTVTDAATSTMTTENVSVTMSLDNIEIDHEL